MSRFLGLGAGKDGIVDLGSYTQLKYTCSGSSGSTSLTATGTFSAGDRLFIHQSRGTGVGYYEDNTVASYTAGTVTLVHPLEHTYTDSGSSQAQVLVVKEASSVTGSYTVPTWDGDKGGLFVIACNGTFSGTVNGNGKGYRNGGAVNGASNQDGQQGEGSSGAGGTQTTSANGNGGGGGKEFGAPAGSAGSGGGGGYASVGGVGTTAAGGGQAAGGLQVGQAENTTLFFGGAGGSGGARDLGAGDSSGIGGDGGGCIVIYAKEISSLATLTVDGTIGSSPTRDGFGGGGGGAGGSILIKAVKTTLGSSKLTAAGALGGDGGNYPWDGDERGGAGSAGRIRIESCSLSGTTSPTASTSTGGHVYCGGSAFLL